MKKVMRNGILLCLLFAACDKENFVEDVYNKTETQINKLVVVNNINAEEDYELEYETMSEDSQKNGPQQSEQAMSEDNVSMSTKELAVSSPLVVSSPLAVSSLPSNIRHKVQKMKDILAQTSEEFEEFETSHLKEVFDLNSELKNLKKQNLELKAQSSEKIANLESELEILRKEKLELMLQCKSLKDENIKLSKDLHSVKSVVEQVFVPYSK